MANYYYSSWISWKILPLSAIFFDFDNGNTHGHWNLLNGSEVRILPIKVENDTGGSDIVGIEMQGEVQIFQDNYHDMKQFFKDIQDQKCTQIKVDLSHGEGDVPNAGYMTLNYAGNRELYPIQHENFNVDWEIKASGISPTLYIRFSGTFSKDIIDNHTIQNSLFYQMWATQGAPYYV